MPDHDVLVVGTGIAGLSAAAMLQASGFDVEVVDRVESLRAVGAGITLHPNARAALGPIDSVLAPHGAEIVEQVVEDHHGVRSRLAWDAVWHGRFPLGIERGVLAEQLFALLDPATVRFSTHPVALDQSSDAVSVELSDGRTTTYGLVVGADGIHSWVRRQVVDPEAKPHYLGQAYWRTILPATGGMAFRDWRVWRSGPHYAGGLPVGHGRSHFFLQMATPDPPVLTGDGVRPAFESAAAGFPPGLRGIVASIAATQPLHFATAWGMHATRWTAGRVGLLGDAAHALSPASTQGGAMAMEDARVLTEELTAHGLGPRALASYERRRRPRVDHVERMTRLHLMLLESNMPGGAGDERAQGGPATWYRKLYGPLARAA